MTDPKVTPPMSAREWYNANLHKHVAWLSMLEAYAAHIAAPLEAENTALKARVEQLEKALDKLARLGNEPHFGNSRGNEIARAALAGKSEKGTK